MYAGSVGLGYLNATSSGSLMSSRLTMLNSGNERPISDPPMRIAACLFLLVAQYVRSNNIAEGIQMGTAMKSYG